MKREFSAPKRQSSFRMTISLAQVVPRITQASFSWIAPRPTAVADVSSAPAITGIPSGSPVSCANSFVIVPTTVSELTGSGR